VVGDHGQPLAVRGDARFPTEDPPKTEPVKPVIVSAVSEMVLVTGTGLGTHPGGGVCLVRPYKGKTFGWRLPSEVKEETFRRT
jgi:hypothetical protein